MRISIDANEANVENRVGISEFAYQILVKLYNIRKEGKNNHYYQILLKSDPQAFLPQETSWWQYKKIGPKKLWTQIGLPFYLYTNKRKSDVILTLTHYAPRKSPIPTIVSVMDLSFLHYPETFNKNDLYQLTRWTKYSVEKAKAVITISQSSKNDIIKYYRVPKDRIKVVHLGLKELSMNTSNSDLSDFGISKKIILYVGTLQPRKNISRLIEAYSLLPDKIKSEHQLVIVGKKGWMYQQILKSPEKYGVTKDVLFLDYVSDQDLPLFYKKAEIFVLPSLYEGFGLPILEAMKYGCPVVTSNVSSMPEAGGDSALYFDPEDTKDMSSKIESVLTDKKLRDDMIEKGYQHIKKFTWEKAAEEVLEVVEQTIEKK